MNKAQKEVIISGFSEKLKGVQAVIIAEYRGLKVKEIAEIRRALRKQDVTYRVVKNRLMRIAAEDSVGEALSPLLTGPTAIAFGNDEAGTAKAVLDATRPYKIVRITGAVLGDKAKAVEQVASDGSQEDTENKAETLLRKAEQAVARLGDTKPFWKA